MLNYNKKCLRQTRFIRQEICNEKFYECHVRHEYHFASLLESAFPDRLRRSARMVARGKMRHGKLSLRDPDPARRSCRHDLHDPLSDIRAVGIGTAGKGAAGQRPFAQIKERDVYAKEKYAYKGDPVSRCG